MQCYENLMTSLEWNLSLQKLLTLAIENTTVRGKNELPITNASAKMHASFFFKEDKTTSILPTNKVEKIVSQAKYCSKGHEWRLAVRINSTKRKF